MDNARVRVPPAMAELPWADGRPVPWVARWGQGKPPRAVVRVGEDPHFGPVLECDCEPGRGQPVAHTMCPVRQRAGMLRSHCGECGTALLACEDAVFIGPVSMPAYIRPPLHPQCATYVIEASAAHSGRCRGMEVVLCDGGFDLYQSRRYGTGLETQRLMARLEVTGMAGVLDFLFAVPRRPKRLTPAHWLAIHGSEGGPQR